MGRERPPQLFVRRHSCLPAKTERRGIPCPRSGSSFAPVTDEGGIFRAEHPAFQVIAENPALNRPEIPHFELVRFRARRGHDARNNLPTPGQLHMLAFLDPFEEKTRGKRFRKSATVAVFMMRLQYLISSDKPKSNILS
jgi:hypothetical protein